MLCLHLSSAYPKDEMEGTLLTKEQVEEISGRISKNVTEEIQRQLDKVLQDK